MSSHHLSRRAVVALPFVALSLAAACASRGPHQARAVAGREVIDTSSIANGEGKTMENLFTGRFPGVSVSRADGGGLQIRIRGGSNTFYGSNEPLYVVDDIPLASGNGGIVFLNPYDIQKIEVLKNPADIGIYGLRGANGVIKITTRKPPSH